LQVAESAERLIRDVAFVECNLFSVEDEFATELASVEDCFATTTTDCLELLDFVRDLKESARSRECDSLKVGADAERENRDVLKKCNPK
jgi:hypothetical protein